MALTTQDLGQIRTVLHEVANEVVHKVVNEAVDASETRTARKIDAAAGELAIAAQKQFLAIDLRFDRIDARLDGLAEDVAVIKDTVKDHSFEISRLKHRTA